MTRRITSHNTVVGKNGAKRAKKVNAVMLAARTEADDIVTNAQARATQIVASARDAAEGGPLTLRRVCNLESEN
jgi:cell division septum initiation protein DivIVA